MALTHDDIVKIARLSKLKMSAEQVQQMQSELSSFFDFVGQMQAVDTTGIEPLAHPTHAMLSEKQPPITLRLREDVVSEQPNRELNQQNAPLVESGLFLVPKVIE